MSRHQGGRLLLVMAALCAAASGCASAGLFVLNSSANRHADHERHADVPYGTEPWQRLDAYIPHQKSGAVEFPVLIFIYGGGWESGAKEQYAFVAEAFTSRGYAVVIPDYIKYPDGRFPQFMQDAAKAVRWTLENIGAYGGDAQNLFLMGHSAGAHLGALLLADERYLKEEVLDPDAIRAFVGLSGPYNFTPDKPVYQAVFGPPENYPEMRASNFIDGSEPPMFLAIGGQDAVVHPLNYFTLSEMIRTRGGRIETKIYPQLTHPYTVAVFGRLLRQKAPLFDDVLDYLERMRSR